MPDDEIARYAFSKSYFRADGTVKHSAFMPAGDGNTSVFVVTDSDDKERWEIGDRHVAPLRGKPVIARIEIQASHVERNGLAIVLDNHPPRHANISGWPDDDAKKMETALSLAENSALIKR